MSAPHSRLLMPEYPGRTGIPIDLTQDGGFEVRDTVSVRAMGTGADVHQRRGRDALTFTALSSLSQRCVLVGLLVALFAAGSDSGIRAEVQRAKARVEETEDQEVVTLKLRLGLRLQNLSTKGAFLPKFQTRGSGSDIRMLDAQAKQSDGKWAYLVRTGLYDTGATRHAPCTALSPGSAGSFGSIAVGVTLLRKQVNVLGDEPTMRVNLLLTCRKPEGAVVHTAIPIDELRIRLDPQLVADP